MQRRRYGRAAPTAVLSSVLCAFLLVAPGTASAAPPRAPVTVGVGDINGQVGAVDVRSGVAGRPLDTTENPQAVAITPDARTALFTSSGGLDLRPVDLPTRMVGAPFGVLGTYGPIAISPDGTTAWVGDRLGEGGEALQAVDLRTRAVRGFGLGGGNTRDVVLTPDDRTVFASVGLFDGRTGVLAVDTTSGAVRPLSPLADAGSMTMTPDGRTLFVTTTGGVVPVDVAGGRAGAALDLAASPDGRRALSAPGLRAIDVATRTTGPAVPGTAGARAVELTPAGDRAFLALGGRPVPVDLSARRVGALVGTLDTTAFAVAPA